MLKSDFISRRNKLFELLPNKDSIVIVYGKDVLKRIPTIPYPFHQFSDFYYLTGQERPGGALVMHNLKGEPRSMLFMPCKDAEAELWDGFRTSFDEAAEVSGVDEVLPFKDFDIWIERNTPNTQNVFCSFPPHQNCHKSFRKVDEFLDQIRVVKTPKEIELIKKASSITLKAMSESLGAVKPGLTERFIAAKFENACIENGATDFAYPAECQSGSNALCLHYTENMSELKEGDCLLLDAGAEYQHYASDFTRTVPIGKISPIRQSAVEIVKEVKESLVKMTKAGKFATLNDINIESKKMLMKGLSELGIKNVNCSFTLRDYYPHSVSHFIGLDVHDCNSIDRETYKLQKGNVFSIEPGLYFQYKNKDCPEELKGVGIRFEDTVILE